ncbi:EVE domain-containing protein [bacterium CPR1]|nr:EVE domain-containing protein [bacterium CPR1]
MSCWLLKSEPEVFSIDDLRSKRVEGWDGVRNYQARNYLKSMRKGDRAFFYHSREKPPGIVGICKVVRIAYPDDTASDPTSPHYDPRHTAENPVWFRVDVEFVEKFPRLLSLDVLKATRGLEQMVVTRKGSRLSVQPVTAKEWKTVLKLLKS